MLAQRGDEGGLEFEIVFYVRGTDYAAYMDAQQTVLLDLLENLRLEGVTLTGPARRVTAQSAPAQA